MKKPVERFSPEELMIEQMNINPLRIWAYDVCLPNADLLEGFREKCLAAHRVLERDCPHLASELLNTVAVLECPSGDKSRQHVLFVSRRLLEIIDGFNKHEPGWLEKAVGG